MRAVLLLGGLGLLACGRSADGGGHPKPRHDESFPICRGRGAPTAPAEGFRHTASSLLALTESNHSAQDAIPAPDVSFALGGKFTYGPLSSDLEDEDVRVWLDDCDAWRVLGDFTTDADGRISLDVPFTLPAGVYQAHFRVLGDGTATTAFVWVLPSGTRVIVTDIDGTLTASDSELFRQILDGNHVPVPYPGAVDLTTAHADAGSVVVYLTGRPYWLTQKTRDWTRDLELAPGPLHVADSNEEALPGEAGVGAYKLAWLEALVQRGIVVDFAYGNASTDLSAYLGAGFEPERIWMIGALAEESGTHGAVDTWEPRVAEVRELEPVSQPF